jgi:hypothetical protein
MRDNEFGSILDEKIADLIERKKKITDNLLDGNWHAEQAGRGIASALDSLEEMSKNSEVNVTQELLSLLEQVPTLIKSVWSSAIAQTKAHDDEINRWKEMGSYYSQFMENKKKEEELKKKEEELKKKEEIADLEIREAIVSGDLSEPTRMDAIRRKPGTKPPMSLSRFRKLAAAANNEETTDVDDSRG